MTDLDELRDRLRQLSGISGVTWGVLPSGIAALDVILPSGGFRRGTLVEWIAAESGSGATVCALRAAGEAMIGSLPLVVVDRAAHYFPPSLPRALDRERVLLVRCRSGDDASWACDQALRTSGVGPVVTWLDACDERRLRRWQLAAERSGALGLIVRHMPQQPEACFSDVRILVTPLSAAEGRPVRLEILRSRQGGIGAAVEVRLDDDANPLSTLTTARRRAIGS